MTETATRAPRLLRMVFVIHGVITLAGAFVLAVFPTAIPALVGIDLQRPEYLLVYLVGAAELAVAVLSFGATRITDPPALRLIANTVLRFAVVAVFILVWRAARRHHT